MRLFRTIILGCGFLLVAAPLQGQKPTDLKKQILGKWETSQKVRGMDLKVQVQFDENGRTTVQVEEFKIDGKYAFPASDAVELELRLKEEVKKERYQIKISGDTLELKDSEGRVDKFKRVK
jgi:uncharacterized protein (TIGR03066 family)